ncbi:unnamed protein product [Notodromas monacha]|uniref:O-acyltransferase WSD1 C-terminal domain-containing protein n=1 Tax=Notodromas monacha TaxID=399045 RepID=A0A7R9BRR0_9CRUS|nr:unnamed protein product [Notodromas monacha]CAG0919084.1 unnamed protein product [Notodromas monacha]
MLRILATGAFCLLWYCTTLVLCPALVVLVVFKAVLSALVPLVTNDKYRLMASADAACCLSGVDASKNRPVISVLRFSVSNHVGPVNRLDGTEITYKDEKDLLQIFNSHVNKPFPKKSSPWEICWVHKTKSGINNSNTTDSFSSFRSNDDLNRNACQEKEEETAIWFRAHHCLGDGVSLCFALLPNFVDDEPSSISRGKSADVAPVIKHYTNNNNNNYKSNVDSESQQDFAKKFGDELPEFPPAGVIWIKTIFAWILGFFTAPIVFLRWRTNPDKNPMHKNRLSGQKSVHFLPPIPIGTMKTVRNLFGGLTINDIVSTAASRAIWRYITPDLRQITSDSASQKYSLSDMTAVSLWTKFPDNFENKFALCRCNMPRLTKSSDVVGSLMARRREIDVNVKIWNLGFPLYMAQVLLVNALPASVANAILSPPKGVSVNTSNVRGPMKSLRVLGRVIKRIYAFPPQLGSSGLGVMTFGYSGKLFVSVVADSSNLRRKEDLVTIANYLEEEIAHLEDVLGNLVAPVGPQVSIIRS